MKTKRNHRIPIDVHKLHFLAVRTIGRSNEKPTTVMVEVESAPGNPENQYEVRLIRYPENSLIDRRRSVRNREHETVRDGEYVIVDSRDDVFTPGIGSIIDFYHASERVYDYSEDHDGNPVQGVFPPNKKQRDMDKNISFERVTHAAFDLFFQIEHQ
jgi:hypothetical protein